MQKTRKTVGIVVIFGLLLSAYIVNTLFVLLTLDNLYDFGSFIASGQFANAGENPYSGDSPLILAVRFPEIKHSGIAPNLNPPISVLIFQVIANFHPFKSILIWRITTVILFLLSVFLLAGKYPRDRETSLIRFAWALSMAGFWHTIQLGQIYTFALLTAVGAWLMLSRNKSIAGGIFLGILIAIKPNFIFWAFLLAIAGNRSAFFSAGITAVSISIIPVFFHGTNIYFQWLEASRIFTPDLLIFPGNNSLQGLTAHFGVSQVGIILSIILAIGILFYGYKNKPAIEAVNSLGIVTSLLISPIAWTGYTMLALPIFFERKRWHLTHWLAAFIFAIPFYFPLTLFQDSFFNFVVLGWLYGWGLLSLLGELLIQEQKSQLEKISSTGDGRRRKSAGSNPVPEAEK